MTQPPGAQPSYPSRTAFAGTHPSRGHSDFGEKNSGARALPAARRRAMRSALRSSFRIVEFGQAELHHAYRDWFVLGTKRPVIKQQVVDQIDKVKLLTKRQVSGKLVTAVSNFAHAPRFFVPVVGIDLHDPDFVGSLGEVRKFAHRRIGAE